MSTAYTLDGMVKSSFRICGNFDGGVDLKPIIREILKDCGGFGGGHRLAVGASIPQEKEDVFLRNALSVLNNLASKAV